MEWDLIVLGIGFLLWMMYSDWKDHQKEQLMKKLFPELEKRKKRDVLGEFY